MSEILLRALDLGFFYEKHYISGTIFPIQTSNDSSLLTHNVYLMEMYVLTCSLLFLISVFDLV